jgi:hypothetical protein
MSFAASGMLALVCLLLLVFAVTSPGYPVRHVRLHDGGIWVTNNHDGLFGRLNKPIRQLDGGFSPAGGAQARYDLDILQTDNVVVAVDHSQGKLTPIDGSRTALVGSASVPLETGYQVALGGTSIAVVDPATGRVWAGRTDATGGTVASVAGVDIGNSPQLSLKGTAAAVTVGVDGTVYAASASQHTLQSLRPTAAGFVTARSSSIPSSLKTVELAAVGSQLATLDPSSGALSFAGGSPVTIPGVSEAKPAQLQQTAAQAYEVLVATHFGLYAVSGGGRIRTLYGAPADNVPAQPADLGSPAQPARLGSCVHAAWAGTPGTYVRSCGAQPGAKIDLPAGTTPLSEPVFRINHDQIVLNDRDNGAVFDIDGTPIQVANWDSIKPNVKPQDDDTNHRQSRANTDNTDRPPQPKADNLGARAGRTSVLHVLDNDSDPDGDVLVISAVTPTALNGATLTTAPDGQTVQIAIAAGLTGTLHFRYRIDDGHGQSGQADVNVQLHGAGQNGPPTFRPGYLPPALTVAANARSAIRHSPTGATRTVIRWCWPRRPPSRGRWRPPRMVSFPIRLPGLLADPWSPIRSPTTWRQRCRRISRSPCCRRVRSTRLRPALNPTCPCSRR